MFSELQALRATTCLSSGFMTTVINIIIRAGTIFLQHPVPVPFIISVFQMNTGTASSQQSLTCIVCRKLFVIGRYLRCRTHILVQILHIGYFISPTFSKDTGRMGRKNYLAIFIQPSKCIKQLLLPTNM